MDIDFAKTMIGLLTLAIFSLTGILGIAWYCQEDIKVLLEVLFGDDLSIIEFLVMMVVMCLYFVLAHYIFFAIWLIFAKVAFGNNTVWQVSQLGPTS